MSPVKADDPLRKVTLNLYESDCAFLEAHLGHGWTEQVRQWVHQHSQNLAGFHRLRKTLGDLE